MISHHMDRPHFVYSSSGDGHLGCLPSWPLRTKLPRTSVYVFWGRHLTSFLSGIFLGVELLGQGGNSNMFNTLRSCRLFSLVAAPFHTPVGSYEDPKFSTCLSMLVFVGCLFLIRAVLVVSLWLWFACPWWLMMRSISSCTDGSLVYLLWRNVSSLAIFKF